MFDEILFQFFEEKKQNIEKSQGRGEVEARSRLRRGRGEVEARSREVEAMSRRGRGEVEVRYVRTYVRAHIRTYVRAYMPVVLDF